MILTSVSPTVKTKRRENYHSPPMKIMESFTKYLDNNTQAPDVLKVIITVQRIFFFSFREKLKTAGACERM